MLRCNLTVFRLAALASALVFAVASASAAPADELKEAQRLYAQGKLPAAMEKVDGYLKLVPREPQGRFLKGLILTEQKKTAEAIQVFTGLTEDFPELPEPYNNLAVLYAAQGNYDKAKSSLELAIHTHPSYATAHENLGDVYAQLASRAYDRALSLDKSNTTAQVKLAMVKDLFSPQKAAEARKAPTASRAPDPVRTDVAPPAKPAEAAKPPEPAKVAESTKAPAGDTKVAKVETKPAGRPADAAKAPASGDAKAQVTAAVEAWARAWSAKDVPAYLASYAPEFAPAGGESRDAWAKARKERIEKPKSIEVSIRMHSVTVSGDEATAVFRQTYQSDTLKSGNTKTLKLAKSGDRWLIRQEIAGK